MFVNAIYEPPQSGNADSLQLERGTEEEAAADLIAAHLGWVLFQLFKLGLLAQEAAADPIMVHLG